MTFPSKKCQYHCFCCEQSCLGLSVTCYINSLIQNKELAYVKTSLLSTLDKLKKVENEKDNLESKLSDSKKEVRRLTKEKEDLQKIIHHLYRRLCVFTDELNKMCKQAEVGSKVCLNICNRALAMYLVSSRVYNKRVSNVLYDLCNMC